MSSQNETCDDEQAEGILNSLNYVRCIHEFQIISETLIEIYQIKDAESICKLAGEAIHKFNKDCYIIVSLYDHNINAIRIRDLIGFESIIEKILSTSYLNLNEIHFEPEELELNSCLLTTGKLEYFKGELYALLAKKAPYDFCKKIEHDLNIGSILISGFSNEKKIFGSISILLPEGKKVNNISAIETIVAHVSKKVQDIKTEKEFVEAKRKAMENESLLRSMMDAVTESVVLLKRDLTVAYINETAAERLNITQEKCIGYSLDSIIPEDILINRKKMFNAVLTERKPMNFRDERNGLHFIHNIYPIYDSSNQLSYFAIFSVNITKYKKSEKELKWELAVNKELAELADALLDPNNSIETIADIVLSASQRLTGSDHGYVSSIDPETGNNVCHTLTRMMEKCKINEKDKRISFPKDANGLYPKLFGHSLNTKKGFYTNSPKTHSASGGTPEGHILLDNFLSVPAIVGKELVGQICLANSRQEYSESEFEAIRKVATLYALALQQKQASIEIQYRDTLLKSVFESTIDSIFVTDSNHNIHFLNSKFARMLGLPDNLDNTRNCYKLTDLVFDEIKDPEEHISKIYALCESNEIDISYVYLKDGRTFERSSAPLVSNGILKGRVWSLRDVTEKVEAEKALVNAKIHAEEANRTKSEFLATMSHELRTPLNSIIGYSDMLIEKMFGTLNEKQLKYLRNISLSGNHLLNLINDILDISRIESGDMSLSFETVRAADIFEDVKNIATPFATSKNILVKFSAEPADLDIYADKIKFKQILHNLVNNALKFTPENGHIEVEARKLENKIEISVTDNGIGIPEDKQQMIFEPFKQVDSSLSRKYNGTGLGLTIVKHLVELHGGEIKVKSELARGSTFTVLWPVKEKRTE